MALRTRAGWSSLAAALVVGLLADQALRTGSIGIGASLTLAVAAAALMALSTRRLEARLLALGAICFGAWLTVRASPWLLWPDFAAVLVLLAIAASLAVRGSVLDLGIADLLARSFHGILHALAGATFVAEPLRRDGQRVSKLLPIVRGILIAIPVAGLLAALLASADPIFASFFRIDVDFGRLILDLMYVLVGALCAAGLIRLAAATPLPRVDGPSWRLGPVEGLVVLSILDALFAAFAVAQAIGVAGAGAETLRSAGMTYADYARSGFFQLLWVAGITLLVIVLFSRATRLLSRRARIAFLVLAELAVALTLLIVLVAFRRLSLYEEAYGFTMLRLYSHVFAVWVGVVFLLLAADLAGAWKRRRWFVGSVLLTGLLVTMALNLVNPEALVVQMNVRRGEATHKLDGGYLEELSSDAVPTLFEARAHLPGDLWTDVERRACVGSHSSAPDWAAYNWSTSEAAKDRRQFC